MNSKLITQTFTKVSQSAEITKAGRQKSKKNNYAFFRFYFSKNRTNGVMGTHSKHVYHHIINIILRSPIYLLILFHGYSFSGVSQYEVHHTVSRVIRFKLLSTSVYQFYLTIGKSILSIIINCIN